MTATLDTIAADLAADLATEVAARLVTLEKARAMAANVMTAWPFVIGFENGLYLSFTPDAETLRVSSVTPCDILRATHVGPEDAERLTANGNIRNGHGETAAPIGYVQGLDAEIARQREFLASLEAMAA